MADAAAKRISITRDGPYVVEGRVPLTRRAIEGDDLGESWEWREIERLPVEDTYRLCRCGGSGDHPFCDDSCQTNGFDGTETADRRPHAEIAKRFEGPTVELADATPFCAVARFCDARGSVWALVREDDPDSAALVERAVARCPSGRLVLWPKDATASPGGDGDRGGGRSALEPALEPSIALVEDPQTGVSGPIWVRGGIPVVSGDGSAYEVRNRVTLCRCGASRNKPFCDGSHVRVRFRADRAPAAG